MKAVLTISKDTLSVRTEVVLFIFEIFFFVPIFRKYVINAISWCLSFYIPLEE